MIIGPNVAAIGGIIPLEPSERLLCCTNINTSEIENVRDAFFTIES